MQNDKYRIISRAVSIYMLLYFFLTGSSSCERNREEIPSDIDFRQEMRDFVTDLSNYSKGLDPGFIIIPQNGQELITDNGEADG